MNPQLLFVIGLLVACIGMFVANKPRMDDINKEEIERRLNWFESDVIPAVEYFRAHSKYNFIELDGDQPVEAVQQELLLKAFG